MPWHLTPAENLQSILRDGLRPAIGPRSEAIPEEAEAVHLFSTFADLEDAGWVEDAFEEDQKLCLLHVSVPAWDGAWTEAHETIPPNFIRLISPDFDQVAPSPAYDALDLVDMPFADLGQFRATRVEMSAEEFGQLVSDIQWEGDDARFLVYGAAYYIGIRDDGRRELHIESEGWLEGHDGETLESLEARLFEWAREQDPSDEPGENREAPGI